MNLDIKDKIIIVTGGSKGIGGGIVSLLAKEGAVPIIIGRNKKDILSAFKKLQENGYKAGYAFAELTKPEECKKSG